MSESISNGPLACSDDGSVDCSYHYDSSDTEDVASPVWTCPACDFADNSPYDAECSLCLVKSPTLVERLAERALEMTVRRGECGTGGDEDGDHLTRDSVRRGFASLSLGHGGDAAGSWCGVAEAEAMELSDLRFDLCPSSLLPFPPRPPPTASFSSGRGLEFEFPPYLLEVRAPPSALETIAEDVFAEICRFL